MTFALPAGLLPGVPITYNLRPSGFTGEVSFRHHKRRQIAISWSWQLWSGHGGALEKGLCRAFERLCPGTALHLLSRVLINNIRNICEKQDNASQSPIPHGSLAPWLLLATSLEQLLKSGLVCNRLAAPSLGSAWACSSCSRAVKRAVE